MSDMNKQVIEEFRVNQGKVGGFFQDMNLLLIHTTGAKTGKHRINPTAYFKEGDQLVIAASKAGADNHPDWYYNITAHPEVVVEVGSEKFNAQADITSEPERSRLYDKLKGIYPGFGDYEKKTDRIIPVITLTKL